jgi:hypothetical protein
MFEPTLAYLLTWTTYGTWLHGDQRTSASRKQSRVLKPDPVLEAQMRRRMKHPPLTLDAKMRRVVRETIEEHSEYRGWTLMKLNVRTNHIHLVVTPDADGQKMDWLVQGALHSCTP